MMKQSWKSALFVCSLAFFVFLYFSKTEKQPKTNKIDQGSSVASENFEMQPQDLEVAYPDMQQTVQGLPQGRLYDKSQQLGRENVSQEFAAEPNSKVKKSVTMSVPFKGMIPLQYRIQKRQSPMPKLDGPTLNPNGTIEIVSFIDPNDSFGALIFKKLKQFTSARSNLKWSIHWMTRSENEMDAFKIQVLTAMSTHKNFWDIADVIVNSRMSLKTKSDLFAVLSSVGISEKQLATALMDQKVQDKMSEGYSIRAQLGVGNEASVFLNGVRMYTVELMDATIESVDEVVHQIASYKGI